MYTKHKYMEGEGGEKKQQKLINQNDAAQNFNDTLSQTIRATLANRKLHSHTVKGKV